MSRLAVIVDGRALPEDEARALWNRFSAHMDQHQGDFDGFAAAVGYAAASVAVVGDRPTLRLTSASESPAPGGSPETTGAAKGGEARGRRSEGRRGRAPKQERGQARPDDGRDGSAPPRRKKPKG